MRDEHFNPVTTSRVALNFISRFVHQKEVYKYPAPIPQILMRCYIHPVPV